MNEGIAQGAYAAERDLHSPDAKVEPKRHQGGPEVGPRGRGEGAMTGGARGGHRLTAKGVLWYQWRIPGIAEGDVVSGGANP